jgi:hypothetical protein
VAEVLVVPSSLKDYDTMRRNCQLALRIWRERVDPVMVDEGLQHWRCGTTACFGGHLARWPEFRAIPDSRELNGSPDIATRGASVDFLLFGADLFSAMSDWEHESGIGAYATVAVRLEAAINQMDYNTTMRGDDVR